MGLLKWFAHKFEDAALDAAAESARKSLDKWKASDIPLVAKPKVDNRLLDAEKAWAKEHGNANEREAEQTAEFGISPMEDASMKGLWNAIVGHYGSTLLGLASAVLVAVGESLAVSHVTSAAIAHAAILALIGALSGNGTSVAK